MEMAFTASPSRERSVPLTITNCDVQSVHTTVNQRNSHPDSSGFVPVGTFWFMKGALTVGITNRGTTGKVVIDAMRVRCNSEPEPELQCAAGAWTQVDLENGPPTADDPRGAVVTGPWVTVPCDPGAVDCQGLSFVHDKGQTKGSLAVEFFLTPPSPGVISWCPSGR